MHDHLIKDNYKHSAGAKSDDHVSATSRHLADTRDTTMQACTSPCEQEQTSGATDRGLHEDFSCDATLGHQPSKTHGCAKRGGRPVTWIGGGGLDPKKLAGLGVPVLRDLFKQVFGEYTASNNAGWLRRKLSESPDSVHGQCRSRVVRARDSGAAIWNRPLIMLGVGEEDAEDEALAAAAEAEGQGEAGGCTGGFQAPVCEQQEADVVMQETAGTAQGFGAAAVGAKPQHHVHRSLKRSCTEASQNFRERAAAARCPSPSASGSASPTATHQDGCVSPRANSHAHKQQQHRHHHHTHKQHQQHHQHSVLQQPSSSGACGNNSSSSMPGHVIHPDQLCDDWVGCQVMVFWPADNRWWAATICGLSTATQQLQLLYADQTEEVLAGQDFCDLLHNGHLALAAGQAPPPSSATGYTVSAHGPAAAACGTAMLAGLSVPAELAAAAAAAGSDAAGGLTRRVQSCQLPVSLAGSGSMAAHQEFARSASVSFGVNCGGSGVNYAGARVSVSGSGSGTEMAVDFEELAAKRACYEPSINNSDSDGSNPAEVTGFLGFYGISMAAAERQQGPQAAQLGAWFASQQRQQQQLQLQMQANLQLQQQVQMQIQHQVAAHLSMQQAAGQVMQLQPPALSSPFAGMGSPAAAAPAGLAVMPAEWGSLFVGGGAFPSRTAAAAAMAAVAANAANTANMGVPCQQMQQLDSQLPQSASPVAAAAAGPGSSSQPTTQQHQVMQPGAGFAPCKTSPKACDHVVPEMEPQAAEPRQQQQQAAAAAIAAPSAGFRLPQLNLQAPPAGTLQPASAVEIDSLLTKAGRDLFELDDLTAAAGIDSIDGLEEMEEDAIAAACGLDSGGDGLGGDACSSGNNSSLCESMADELAVAGIEAEDAAGYYMFGGAGSPRPGQEQQQLQQVAVVASAGGCQGLVYPAGVQGLVGGGAAASATCGNADAIQLAGSSFKVAQAPCQSSFAHMFDFY